MKFIRILLLLIIGNSFALFAQNPISNHDNNEKDYHTALELFEKEKYAAAKVLFEQYLIQSDENDYSIKAQNCLVLCALYLRNPDFDYLIHQLVSKYPTHPLSLNTYTQIGTYFFNQGDYSQASKYLRKIDLNKPTLKNVHLAYMLAYSYFINKDYHAASKIFQKIKGGEHEYAYLSSYYAGYIAYNSGDYATASTDMSKAIKDEKIKDEAELLLVSIYYRQKRYGEVINQILKSKKSDLPAYDILIADSYLMQGDSALAVQYFEKYVKRTKTPIDRVLFYKMAIAYSCSYVNKLSLSTYYLSKVANENDSLAQIGAYQLGIMYIRIHDKNAAINAFDKCRKLKFNRDLQKSSAFHYARLNFETDDTKNAIDGCLFFEKNFPNDLLFMQEINRMRSEAYLNSGNYQNAMIYIEKMPTKDPKAQLAYQRIAYNRAVELFNNRELRSAKSALRKSLIFPHNSDMTNAAYYFLGEASSLMQAPDSAIHFYKKVEENGKYFPESCLGIAYAYFQLEEYSSAIPYFRKYISIGNKDKIHEAYTKLGDTYFKIKDFSNALIAYQSALEHGSIDFPHNSYHRALCLMELKRFGEADVILELFTERNNDHPYIDWANYQRAVLYYENRRKDLAVNVLSQIIDKKSDSKIIPFVLLRRGDIYAETTVYNRAVNDYKTIVEKFPATEVAEQALQRLQSLQMQGIPVPNLNYLISRLIRPQSSNPFSQNFEYRNAQVYYENGDYANAILTLTRLVQSAPKSESMNEVEYLLGQCYIAIGDIERAGIYLERSNLRQGLLKSAAIDFQIGFFQSAVSKYEKILKNYAEDNEKIDAKIGLIKSYFALKNYEKVMYYLDELKNSKSNFTQPVEHLYFGKIYLAQGQHEEAKDSFEKVIKLTNDAYAAEAQYLIGLVYREQGNYLSSNEELQKVKEKYQVHTIWVYESLFVIADNYLALDNLFQAKATLQWIMDNSQDAKLVNRAKEKLGEWDR